MGIIFKLKVPSTTIGYQCLREWFRDSWEWFSLKSSGRLIRTSEEFHLNCLHDVSLSYIITGQSYVFKSFLQHRFLKNFYFFNGMIISMIMWNFLVFHIWVSQN
jgi:hypothetical protein